MKNKIELLSPAGDIIKGKYALNYGADAIYLGAKAYSLRARSSNFDFKEVTEIINYAHSLNKKVYLVTNIVCHNAHLSAFDDFIKQIIPLKPDAYICTDPFIMDHIRQHDKNAEIHVSTQQSICNSKAALFFKNNGCKRIILARENSYDEIVKMIQALKNAIDIEHFIHGALCIAYSGRCMISNNFSLRDSNVGGCAQSCRWVYKIFDESKTYSNKFTMSAKDMNQIANMPKLIDSGIKSFKIEGRMKSEYYIATVVNTYRKLIDEYLSTRQIKDMNKYLDEIKNAENRPTAQGWFDGHPNKDEMLYHDVQTKVNQIFAFVVYKKISNDTYEVISRNNFNKDMEFTIIGPNHQNIKTKIKFIKDELGNLISVVKTPMSKISITFDQQFEFDKNDIARIVK